MFWGKPRDVRLVFQRADSDCDRLIFGAIVILMKVQSTADFLDGIFPVLNVTRLTIPKI